MREPLDCGTSGWYRLPRLFIIVVNFLLSSGSDDALGYPMKLKLAHLVLAMLLVGGNLRAVAQNDVFYDIDLNANNIWFGQILQGVKILPLYFVDNPTSSYAGDYSIKYNFLRFRENGDPVEQRRYNYGGFKANDLFNWIEVGGKVGWFGKVSPIGVYAQFHYEHQRNKLRLQHDADYGHYRSNAIKPGVGVRIIPWRNETVMPIFELSSSYTFVTSGKTPYGEDKDQFNNGLSYTFSAGVSINEAAGAFFNNYSDNPLTIRAGVTLFNYNYFNRNWSNDGGYNFPYANVKSKRFQIFLTISQRF